MSTVSYAMQDSATMLRRNLRRTAARCIGLAGYLWARRLYNRDPTP